MTDIKIEDLRKELKYYTTQLLVFIFKVVFFGYAIMYLWNILITDIFSLQEITFWQAVGLKYLIHFLLRRTPTKKEMREYGEEREKEIAKL